MKANITRNTHAIEKESDKCNGKYKKKTNITNKEQEYEDLLDVRLLACYDGGLYLHCAAFDLIPTEDHFKMGEQVKDSVDVNISAVNGLYCKWPYISFCG